MSHTPLLSDRDVTQVNTIIKNIRKNIKILDGSTFEVLLDSCTHCGQNMESTKSLQEAVGHLLGSILCLESFLIAKADEEALNELESK
jgi:hypothetical protein